MPMSLYSYTTFDLVTGCRGGLNLPCAHGAFELSSLYLMKAKSSRNTKRSLPEFKYFHVFKPLHGEEVGKFSRN